MWAADPPALKRRIERYLSLGHLPDRRSLVLDVLPAIRDLGPTAIVGGMVRDLARVGPRGYSSDIDLVVAPYDYATFRAEMGRLAGIPNRFGGFALDLGSWSVDIWALPDTWARTSGLRRVDRFEDLLGCTFFDWDAAIYDLGRQELLVADGYFERIASGVLGINLRENPNEAGSAVRALRRAVLWGVRLSGSLAEYILEAERRAGWRRLVEIDDAAFAKPVLAALDWSRTAAALARPISTPFGEAAQLVSQGQAELI